LKAKRDGNSCKAATERGHACGVARQPAACGYTGQQRAVTAWRVEVDVVGAWYSRRSSSTVSSYSWRSGVAIEQSLRQVGCRPSSVTVDDNTTSYVFVVTVRPVQQHGLCAFTAVL